MAISCSPFDRWPADRGGRPPRRIRGGHPSSPGDVLIWQQCLFLTRPSQHQTEPHSSQVRTRFQLLHRFITPLSNALTTKGGRTVFRWYFGHTVDNQSGVTCLYWFFVRKHQYNVCLAFVLDGSSGPQRDKLLFAPIDLQLLSLVEGSP